MRSFIFQTKLCLHSNNIHSPSCSYSGPPHVCTPLLQSRIILKLALHATSSMGLPKSGGAGGIGALVSYKFCEAEKVEKTCQRNSPV